jgi:hypothetical protein
LSESFAEKWRQAFATYDDATVWGCLTWAVPAWMLFVRLAPRHELREIRVPVLLLLIFSLLWQATPAVLPLPLISFLVVFSLERLRLPRHFRRLCNASAAPKMARIVPTAFFGLFAGRRFPPCFGRLTGDFLPPPFA